VLVLVPGTSGGAGSVAPVARDLAARVPGLQVWALDRREEAFEDQSRFRSAPLERMKDYYLGLKFKQPGDAPYVASWGLAVQTRDLRRVVRRASAGGSRQVVLGGHSRGASQAAAYAAWDFGGRPGFRDLAGLVLIDGGLLGFLGDAAKQPYTRATARKAVADARKRPFNDIIGLGVPAIAQIFGQLVGTYAAKAPDTASAIQDEPIVPADLKPDLRVTNEAFFGTIFDRTYSPPEFRALHTRSGALAAGGDPRAWISGERTPIERFSKAFSALGPDFAEWYYPQRLIIDVSGANPMRRDKASTALGLRLFHTARIDTPLYAFQTDLTRGRVLAGARRLLARSDIRTSRLVSDPGMSHLDPVLAAPKRNTFLRTAVPFLKKIARGAR
jgi:pimeloyl-ACP methyl ester carboxylesterase